MKSYFDDSGRPKVDIAVVGLDDQIDLPALIDTGFDGALMLSLPAALSIGLKLSNVVPVVLADGSIRKEFVFEGKVRLGEKTAPVEILLTSSEESLLGTGMLQNHKLTIDFPGRRVVIQSGPR